MNTKFIISILLVVLFINHTAKANLNLYNWSNNSFKELTKKDTIKEVKKKYIISACIGGNIWGSSVTEKYDINSDFDTFSKKTSPMYHLAFDYRIIKRLSAGLSFGYQTNKLNISEKYFISPTDYFVNTYNYSCKRYHFAVRGNYYIVGRENISVYCGLKLGYNVFTFKEEINSNFTPANDKTLNPFTINLHAGARYFFTKTVGINAEIGLGIGGPYLGAIGVCAKF